MLQRQLEIEHAVRKLEEPCPFCGHAFAQLWFTPADNWHPYQVRCDACFARGPACDCGEGSAVPSWLKMMQKPETPDADLKGTRD